MQPEVQPSGGSSASLLGQIEPISFAHRDGFTAANSAEKRPKLIDHLNDDVILEEDNLRVSSNGALGAGSQELN